MDDDGQEHSDEKFAEIVHASLSDVDARPTRLKVLDWILVIAIGLSVALLVGILLGFCVWVWSIVIGKF